MIKIVSNSISIHDRSSKLALIKSIRSFIIISFSWFKKLCYDDSIDDYIYIYKKKGTRRGVYTATESVEAAFADVTASCFLKSWRLRWHHLLRLRSLFFFFFYRSPIPIWFQFPISTFNFQSSVWFSSPRIFSVIGLPDGIWPECPVSSYDVV